MSKPKKIIFLDRDGVINSEVGYLYEIEKFIFIDGVFKELNYLSNLDYEFIIITNQSGIAKGKYSIADYKALEEWMVKQFLNKGVNILDIYFCPHNPEDNCKCRKPKPGLILDALKTYTIDKENSWMIGDKETDIECAQNAGITNTVLVRSGHQIDETNTNASYVVDSIKDLRKII